MAYAAGVGDADACYMDTTSDDGVVAHPLFPVGVEWRALEPLPGVSSEEARRGVHACYDLRITRLLRPGDIVTTRTTITGIQRRKPGAYLVTTIEGTDQGGRELWRTVQGTIFRGVDVVGDDAPPPDDPADVPVLPEAPECALRIPLPATAAHVYTECARIWNPIHTDAAFASAAGIERIILHGTATLAMAVSAIVRDVADGDPRRVRRVRARFGAPATLPDNLRVRLFDGGDVLFDVLDANGNAVIPRGALTLERKDPT